ncbi:MAG: non-canonical purine NTP diphosphatase [Bacteroidales bacterium]|nr:MAG: non-canonical purine NTP diphosphatase [Bacteroidales bacterium]
MLLVFATNNRNKFNEIRDLLGGDFKLLSLDDIGCPDEIPEIHTTLEANASGKAWYIFQRYGYNAFADDTGLEIDALNGEPGVYSARYAGNTKNSEKNMNKVLRKLHGITNRKAQFRTVISLVQEGKEIIFEGIVKGTILNTKRGKSGFGYDPIFLPEGSDKTFAEMNLSEKNRISHRAVAFRKLIEYLTEK